MAESLQIETSNENLIKDAHRFSIGATTNNIDHSSTIDDEIALFNIEKIRDFDRLNIQFDVPTTESEFQPVSPIYEKFWSDVSIKAKYPILSKVALFVSLLVAKISELFKLVKGAVTTTSLERLFSKVGSRMSPTRGMLQCSTLEAMMMHTSKSYKFFEAATALSETKETDNSVSKDV